MCDREEIFVVATPIGNLDDISLRAIKVLRSCDLIAAEDTRVARKLLNYLDIAPKEIISYYDQVEKKKSVDLIARIQRDQLKLALISDAGTPCISDPGYCLISLAREKNILVTPIPGPSSLLALASVSGISCHSLLFRGFLPNSKEKLIKEIIQWKQYSSSVVFFESAKRIIKTLSFINELLPEAKICLGKEITKKYERFFYGKVSKVLQDLYDDSSVLRGEFTVMVEFSEHLPQIDHNLIVKEAHSFFKNKGSVKDFIYQKKYEGVSKKILYKIALDSKNTLSCDSFD